MERRSFLERLTVLGGCSLVAPTVLLQSCETKPRLWSSLSAKDMGLLDELAETILPKTENLPGAKAVEVGKYIVHMVQKCLSTEDRDTFLAGLNTLEQQSIATYEKPFEKIGKDAQYAFLSKLQEEATAFNESQEGLEEPQIHYFSLLKELTITGYFSSEEVLVNGFDYAPIPGRYDGCVDFDPATDKAYWG